MLGGVHRRHPVLPRPPVRPVPANHAAARGGVRERSRLRASEPAPRQAPTRRQPHPWRTALQPDPLVQQLSLRPAARPEALPGVVRKRQAFACSRLICRLRSPPSRMTYHFVKIANNTARTDPDLVLRRGGCPPGVAGSDQAYAPVYARPRRRGGDRRQPRVLPCRRGEWVSLQTRCAWMAARVVPTTETFLCHDVRRGGPGRLGSLPTRGSHRPVRARIRAYGSSDHGFAACR